MNVFSKIWFPAAVLAATAAGVLDFGRESVHTYSVPDIVTAQDTVVYTKDAYKLKRQLKLEDIAVVDTTSTSDTASYNNAALQDTVIVLSKRDSLRAQLDSADWYKIDSICLADSLALLSEKDRKAYYREQKIMLKVALADSLRKAKEARQEERDSIIAEKPRILETFALPDSMQYKRIVSWTLDRDFQKLNTSIPDSSFNYWFHDHPFHRTDVNATWLGVAGSPVQNYNVLMRKSDEGVEFYDALESWSFSTNTLKHYNTKTPYTELAYWGTLFAGANSKEQDNLHLFTTQNITPELNITLMFNRYGGNGILNREKTINKTATVQADYLGKKYMLHAGYINNVVNREENGGITDVKWIRDTTVDRREIKVNLMQADSKVKKNTFFVDQQFRIPFDFINKLKAKKDSTFVFNADSLDRDVTTAFIGHSSDLSFYTRKYTDAMSDADARAFYRDTFFYDPSASADSMRVMKLENRVFLRLQPWSSEGIVSKLDVGIGDYLKQYYDSTTVRPMKNLQNSLYAYAGAEGQFRNNFYWNAKGRYVFLGHDFSDFGIEANAQANFFPFRRARKSPLSLNLHFETTLKTPTYYQQHIHTNHFRWDNDFSKTSRTEVSANLDIPRWKLNIAGGYTLLANNIYYDNEGIVRQNGKAMSVISASLRKDFVFGPVHLENRALFQFSSNQDVVPVPLVSGNARWYLQFGLGKVEYGVPAMTMQIGIDAYANTKWHAPSWNPNLGVFYNQTSREYTNGPYFDVFINMQWKRACIFVKYQNAGMGWPLNKPDYFSADRYIITESGLPGLKLGIFWPFYRLPVGRAPRINR